MLLTTDGCSNMVGSQFILLLAQCDILLHWLLLCDALHRAVWIFGLLLISQWTSEMFGPKKATDTFVCIKRDMWTELPWFHTVSWNPFWLYVYHVVPCSFYARFRARPQHDPKNPLLRVHLRSAAIAAPRWFSRVAKKIPQSQRWKNGGGRIGQQPRTEQDSPSRST